VIIKLRHDFSDDQRRAIALENDTIAYQKSGYTELNGYVWPRKRKPKGTRLASTKECKAYLRRALEANNPLQIKEI
jgi:hypothetical protein